ncbi:MAG: PfkB family carbohydrate kinase [Phycisphaeraceae bacterium]
MPTVSESDRAAVARDTAAALRRFAPRAADRPVMLGFDGFVDSIIDVVDKRHDVQRYAPIDTIATFGQRVSGAAGHSTNFELVVKQRKLGGNGPIMANAMAAAGFDVTYIGALGEPEIDPVFRELADRARVHTVIANGATDALEFTDGKLLLGKYDHLAALTYDRICQVIGEDKFTEIIARSHLIGMVNWTMLTSLDTIWDGLAERILPAIGQRRGDKPMFFVDLCDPVKRTTADLQAALARLRKLAAQVHVVLGVNLKESREVAEAMSLPVDADSDVDLHQRAAALREALGIQCVVVHARRAAGAAVEQDDAAAEFVGPFVRKPYLSTGAGDNFNAGFCLGLLAGLPLVQSLCAGTATSGYYVRQGASPTLDQLADFCDALPEPEDEV